MTNNQEKNAMNKNRHRPNSVMATTTLDSETDTQMTEMLELSNKGIITATKNTLHMFKKVEENMSMMNILNILKLQIEPLEMKISELKNTLIVV